MGIKPKVSVSRARWHRLRFSDPKSYESTGLIERLLSLRGVKAVHLTSEKGVFLAKVKFLDGKEPKDAADYISERLGGSYGAVTEG